MTLILKDEAIKAADELRAEEKAVKHTPGPWYLQNKTMVLYRGGNETPRIVAMCERGAYPHPDGADEANARLIAAGPDLLEALEALVNLVPEPQMVSMGFDSPPEHATEEDYHLGYALFGANAAIAKARGKS